MNTHLSWRLLGLYLALLLANRQPVATLRVFVADAAGQPLPGVEIVARPAAGSAARAVTDGAGWVELGNLTPGHYRVTASLGGFETITRPDVALGNASDVTLELETKVLLSGDIDVIPPDPAKLRGPVAIRGTVTDTCGAVVPGTDVQIRGDDGKTVRRAVSAADGAFVFPDLPPGHYTATASLAGFRTFSDADVQVARGFDTRLDIRLHIASREDVGPWITFGDVFQAARRAPIIVHLRIERVRGVREVCAVAVEYQASVIHVVKADREGGPSSRFELLQQGSGSVSPDGSPRPDEPRYSVGDQFVALLAWNPRLRAFTRFAGPVYMIPIRDGRVAANLRTAGVAEGMSVSELLARLKSVR